MADEPLDPTVKADSEVELDIRAFLPEGAEFGDGWGDDAPEPEIPAWAREDSPASTIEPEASPEVTSETNPTADEQIDLTVLEGIEADLIEVDEAIAALDAGDPSRSPLLQRLSPPE